MKRLLLGLVLVLGALASAPATASANDWSNPWHYFDFRHPAYKSYPYATVPIYRPYYLGAPVYNPFFPPHPLVDLPYYP